MADRIRDGLETRGYLSRSNPYALPAHLKVQPHETVLHDIRAVSARGIARQSRDRATRSRGLWGCFLHPCRDADASSIYRDGGPGRPERGCVRCPRCHSVGVAGRHPRF